MNRKLAEKIVKSLEVFLTLENYEYGICGYIYDLFYSHSMLSYISDISKKWEFYSGDYLYPVPSLCMLSPSQKFESTDNMLAGEYGEKRKDLARFIISELKKEWGIV